MSATELEDIEALARQLQIIAYNAVAALSFSLWDVLITFDDEVAYIWHRPFWDPAKCLYLVIRYFAISVQVALLTWIILGAGGKVWSQQECLRWWFVQVTCIPIIVSLVQALLVLRVCALYNGPRERPLRLFLAAYWAATVIAVFVNIMTHFLRTPIDELCPAVTVIPPSMPSGGTVVFVTASACPFSLEVILLGLTIRKFSVAVKEGWGHTPIMEVVLRDGIWAFALTFAASFITLINSVVVTSVSGSTFPWATAVFAFSAARIVLNTRRLAAPARATATLTTDILSERGEYEANTYHTIASSSQTHIDARTSDPGKQAYPLTPLPGSDSWTEQTRLGSIGSASETSVRSPTSSLSLISERIVPPRARLADAER